MVMANQTRRIGTSRSSGGGTSGGQLNFHQLHIFQMVATHLSFSRAAEALEITQPAVSIQVQELEKYLGITLFHRRPRGLRITEAGEAVLAYSQQIFAFPASLWTRSRRWKTFSLGIWSWEPAQPRANMCFLYS